jgi:hypothetical protein
MDSRIRSLEHTVPDTELLALFNSLYLAVDDDTLAEVAKIAISMLFSSTIIESQGTGVTHRGITAKAFYDTVMTTSRRGVNTIAADVNVTSKTGSAVLTAIHQVLMQAQWKKDWFTMFNAQPAVYFKSSETLADGGAIVFSITYKGDLALGGHFNLSPFLPDGVILDSGYVMCQVQSDNARERGTFDYWYTGAEFIRAMGSTFQLNVSADSKHLILRPVGAARPNTRIALTAHFTTR